MTETTRGYPNLTLTLQAVWPFVCGYDLEIPPRLWTLPSKKKYNSKPYTIHAGCPSGANGRRLEKTISTTYILGELIQNAVAGINKGWDCVGEEMLVQKGEKVVFDEYCGKERKNRNVTIIGPEVTGFQARGNGCGSKGSNQITRPQPRRGKQHTSGTGRAATAPSFGTLELLPTLEPKQCQNRPADVLPLWEREGGVRDHLRREWMDRGCAAGHARDTDGGGSHLHVVGLIQLRLEGQEDAALGRRDCSREIFHQNNWGMWQGNISAVTQTSFRGS